MASPVTTAFVLAAGMGTRMRPLTDNMPKPMVRLKGKPLIDHVLDRLVSAGIERAVVNVHHYADMLIQHLAQRTQPVVLISDERDALLDTGGGAIRALPMLGVDPFIIHNSDCVWIEGVGCNLTRMIEAWDPDRMDSLMLLATASHSLGYDGPGDFNMDADGRLSRRGERRVAPFAFTGVSIAHPRMFDDSPLGSFSLNRLWDVAINRGRLFGLTLDGVWMHVGTPDAVEEAERRIDSDNSH
jgi:MurNAc alpha-1-phosphate uridylyltransferase